MLCCNHRQQFLIRNTSYSRTPILHQLHARRAGSDGRLLPRNFSRAVGNSRLPSLWCSKHCQFPKIPADSRWYRACPSERRTMLRTATLLIVTILAGGPVGSLGCELWCTSPAAEDHHRSVGCHDASLTSPPGPQIASTAGCHDAAAITPFVTEARQTESASIATPPALFESVSIGRGHDKTAAGWCVFDVQPPRPPSSRGILRV